LANADLLPLDYATEATYWRRAYINLEQANQMKFQEELNLIDQWEHEAKNLLNDEMELSKHLNNKRSTQLSELNRKIYLIARDFHKADGFPDDITERNLFSKLPDAKDGFTIYLAALKKRVQSLQSVRKQLQQIQ
jgi:hypothetical protein